MSSNPVKLFIDCEWNSAGGDLISMALVPAVQGMEPFYEVLPYQHLEIDPWVAENVIPFLNRDPLDSYEAFQLKLEAYLNQWESVLIIADWPEDISRFCNALMTGPGMTINRPDLSFKIVRVDATSIIPHNALADAEALRTEIMFKAQHLSGLVRTFY